MEEHEPRPAKPAPSRFGEPLPRADRHGMPLLAASMFGEDCADMPLFSGTPIPAVEKPYVPEDHSMRQELLPGMPEIDYDQVLANDKALRRRHRTAPPLPPAGDLFTAATQTSTPVPE